MATSEFATLDRGQGAGIIRLDRPVASIGHQWIRARAEFRLVDLFVRKNVCRRFARSLAIG